MMPVYPAGQAVDPEARPQTAGVNAVAGPFFSTLQMPIVRGRELRDSDGRATPQVAVVNETMAARLWPAGDALGRRFSLGRPDAPAVEVVGIARDVLMDEFGEPSRPFVFLPHSGRAEEVALIAWSRLDAGTTLRSLETAVHELDADVALFEQKTMADHLADRMDGERGLSRMLGFAGVLALGLAAFGLYGVMAYTVGRRTREIGVRLALGARREDVLRLFLRDGLRLALRGLLFGALPSFAVSLLLSRMLFGVKAVDPVTMAGAASLLAAAALLASYVPARRAVRVDPLAALRAE
jgi:predicted permease